MQQMTRSTPFALRALATLPGLVDQGVLDCVDVACSLFECCAIGSRVLGCHNQHSDLDFYIGYTSQRGLLAFANHVARRVSAIPGARSQLVMLPLDRSEAIIVLQIFSDRLDVEFKFVLPDSVRRAVLQYTLALDQLTRDPSLLNLPKTQRYTALGISMFAQTIETRQLKRHLAYLVMKDV